MLEGSRIARGESGFSLAELLITFALLALVAGMAAQPLVQGLSEYRLETAARHLQSELKSARMLAVAAGAVYQLTIEPEARLLTVIELSDPTSPVRSWKMTTEGIRFKSLPPTALRFFPRGYVRGGTITLENEYGTTVSLEVHPSGRVTVSKEFRTGSQLSGKVP